MINSPDGIRRYEDLVKEAKDIANQALAIALGNSIQNVHAVLDIVHGGTGSSTQNFVDFSTNQLKIDGSKIFRSSCAFQNSSSLVNSDELSGNLRLIACDIAEKDFGPQLRFSGKSASTDLTVFAFGTIAGRKQNNIDGDKSGYLQFNTTDLDGNINEQVRINSFGTVGIGCDLQDELSHWLGNRVYVSGGDVYLDNVGGNHSFKVKINHQLGRLQSLSNFVTNGTESLFLSTGVDFVDNPSSDGSGAGACLLDSHGTVGDIIGCTAIELKSGGFDSGVLGANLNTDEQNVIFGSGSAIIFYTGDPGLCPTPRGQFEKDGLCVFNNITAGGFNNVFNGVGNSNVDSPGYLISDNIKAGVGNPNSFVNAPIGAIYSRQDPPTDGQALYIKTDNHYGNTGWTAVPVEQGSFICSSASCPNPGSCSVWYDTVNNIMWYWNGNARGSGNGSWLSSNVYFMRQSIPGGAGNARLWDFAEDFTASINRHYDYFSPTHVLFNNRHASGKFDLFFQDLQVTSRQAWNVRDPINNFYLFDLVTIKQTQGEPIGGVNSYRWPGDRTNNFDTNTDVDFPDTDFDNNTFSIIYNVVDDGHTYHPNLPKALIDRVTCVDVVNPDAAVVWNLTINTTYGINTTKRIFYDPNAVRYYDSSNTEIVTPSTGDKINRWQFKQNLNRAYRPFLNNQFFKLTSGNRPYNPGYIITVINCVAFPDMNGTHRIISDCGANGSDDISYQGQTLWSNDINPYIDIRGLWPNLLSSGDTVQVVSAEFRKIIGRVSTKGNTAWKRYNGTFGLDNLLSIADSRKVRDIQNFVQTHSFATAAQGNLGGNVDATNFYPDDNLGGTGPVDPGDSGATDQILGLNYYLNLVNSEPMRASLGQTSDSPPLDAVIIAGLWDRVGHPGKLAASVAISYRLALPGLANPPVDGTIPCV